MKIYENGMYRDMTAAEIAAEQAERNSMHASMEYSDLVQLFIARKYTIADEIAINRQRNTKAAEFDAYFAYCEQCKQQAKELLGMED